ncbi:MAG: MFS transporter [Burkholderiaceae bacterium]
MPPILYLLAACNLVIGTGAFGLSGILQPISETMGVSVAVAGQSMTAYAFATALLAPVLLMATSRWPRRATLQLGLLLFAVGTLVCALSSQFAVLILGRVLMGAGAVFTPVAASMAVTLVAPERRGRALSLTFLGMSLSYMIGLPLTAWLGLRYGWRLPLHAVAAASVVMLLLVSICVRRDTEASVASFAGLGRLLGQGEVLRTLLLTLLYFSAIFTVFSYIGPVLQALIPLNNTELSLTLMLFGIAGVMGTLSGGWACDRFGAVRVLRVQLACLASMMLLVPLTVGSYWPMVAVFMVWGVAGFGMMTPQQARLANAAPAQAPILLSLNASMLYFGTALGAAVGGPASVALGFAHLPWVGAFFAALGALTFIKKRG